MHNRSKNLELIFKDWFVELRKDLKRKGAYWTPALVSDDQEMRTVVLRSLQMVESLPQFIIHTDIRSKKWHELTEKSSSALHFYCPKRKWQMRIKGIVKLAHNDTDSTIEWNRLSPNSKKIYSLIKKPGVVIDTPEEGYKYSSDIEKGFDNFGVITFIPQHLESLQLSHPSQKDLHIRAFWNISNNQRDFLSP